jgi:hypothetical protein
VSQDDARIEGLLARYRPAGPPPELRDRVLASVGPPRRSDWAMAGWLSVAAMLVLALGLRWGSERTLREAAETIGQSPVEWTAEAEEAAQTLDGSGAGRRYVGIALTFGGPAPEPFPPQTPTLGSAGETR